MNTCDLRRSEQAFNTLLWCFVYKRVIKVLLVVCQTFSLDSTENKLKNARTSVNWFVRSSILGLFIMASIFCSAWDLICSCFHWWGSNVSEVAQTKVTFDAVPQTAWLISHPTVEWLYIFMLFTLTVYSHYYFNWWKWRRNFKYYDGAHKNCWPQDDTTPSNGAR